MGDVVNPWQKATQEEEKDNSQQFEKGLPWFLQHLPTLKQLNKEASEESKLRPRWTHLEGEKRKVRDYLSHHLIQWLSPYIPIYIQNTIHNHFQKTLTEQINIFDL